jgi:hypothetical protein
LPDNPADELGTHGILIQERVTVFVILELQPDVLQGSIEPNDTEGGLEWIRPECKA